MTPDDRNDPRTARRDADRLDQRAGGVDGDVDHQDLEPSLLATVEAIASLRDNEAPSSATYAAIDLGWMTLSAVPPALAERGGRDRRSSVGIIASPVNLPGGRPGSWPIGLVSAVAAVLLLAIVASDYADVPGGSSTSTVMAAGAPTVVTTQTVEPTDCRDRLPTLHTTPRTVASGTAPVLTRSAGSPVATCTASRGGVDGR